jgi:chaperonin cofactor prefoldin
MAQGDSHRAQQVRAFEEEAEELTTYQLDLLALLEHQLRSVHQTMRQIEKLRNARLRVGPELTNGERGETLAQLHVELDAIDVEVKAQRQVSSDMHRTVDRMQQRLNTFRKGRKGFASHKPDGDSVSD